MDLGKIGIIEAVIQSGNCGGTRVIAERRMRRLRKNRGYSKYEIFLQIIDFFLNRSIIKKTDVRICMALENLGMLRNCEIFEEV